MTQSRLDRRTSWQASSARTAGAEAVGSAVSPNFVLIALPTAAASATINLRMSVATLGLLCLTSLVLAQQTTDRIRLTVASFVLTALGLIVAFRPNSTTATGAVYFLIVCVAMALAVGLSRTRQSAVASLVDGVGGLLLAAVLLNISGLGDTSGSPAAGGNIFTGGERVFFPLLGSLSGGPAIAAGYLVVAIMFIRTTTKYRMYRFACAAAAVYVLVQGDRRAALVAALVIVTLTTLAPRLLRQGAPWAVGLLLTAPFWLEITGRFVGAVQEGFLSQFQRSGERGLSSLNDRFEIWSRSIDFYATRVDPFHQAFGYGTSGHAVSDVARTYARLFGGIDGRSAAPSTHNSVLQSLFEGGWVVAIVLVGTVVCLAWTTGRRNSPGDLASLSFLTVISIVGSSEAILMPGSPQPTALILLALGMIGFAIDSSEASPPNKIPISRSLAPDLGGQLQKTPYK